MTNKRYPALTIDSLAPILTRDFYKLALTDPDESESLNFAADIRAMNELDDESPITFDILISAINDDLADFAHNANQSQYAPYFFDNDDYDDAADESLAELFADPNLALMIASMIHPLDSIS